jgi:diguanylate cyclase (GGDEF)-like protein/PAS domain S-box-containing protein
MNTLIRKPSQITILVIDDFDNDLRVLASALVEKGYQVRCAKNGVMGLAGAKSIVPDLILLDIKMPDLDGYQVCQKLKADSDTKDIPVIFLSAVDDVFDKVKAFQVGGIDYISKPVQIEEVLARVRNQLAIRIQKQELGKINEELEQRVINRTKQLVTMNQKLAQEIKEKNLVQKKLQESEHRLESILNSLEDIVWSVSIKTWETLYLNPAIEKVYGRKAEDFLANKNLWFQMIHPEDYEQSKHFYKRVLSAGNLEFEYRIIRPDHTVRWLRNRAHVIYNSQGIPIRLDGIIYDITEQKEAELQLTHDALHDSLTGLPNRILFRDRVEQVISHSRRHKDHLFAVLFIDLDRFKMINDSFGHGFGDQFLIAIAKILKKSLREIDTIARLGGDEFTILLDEVADLEEVCRITERILQNLMSPLTIQGHTIFPSASIGVVLSLSGYGNEAELLRNADIAMYHAKELGKGRYAIFDQEMYERSLQMMQIDTELRSAMETKQFVLYYQPIVSLITGKLEGLEALIRWPHPQKGFISPDQFIPVAEETGLIGEIGEWVLREACSQLRTWQQKYPQTANLKVSVNVSGRQFQDENFLKKLDQILTETGLSGHNLKLELTETILMDQGEKTIKILNQIRAKNIELSIDDFGKGYSSLSYLHRFPINTLKIDRSFVTQMNQDSENWEIARTITTLAHSLNMNVIAEGAETKEQIIQLQQLGCEMTQGYFLSKPLDKITLENLINSLSQQLKFKQIKLPNSDSNLLNFPLYREQKNSL